MKTIQRTCRVLGAAVAAVIVLGATAASAADPVLTCQSAKNKAAGKYASCRQNAEAKLATKGDVAAYGLAIAKCETKFTTSWQKAIDQAANKSATCLDDPLTGPQFQSVVDQHTANVATALGGGDLLDYAQAVACGNGVIDVPEDCDQGDLNGESCVSQGFGAGTLACGPGCVFDTAGCFTGPRFVDNSDGTVTDNASGLMWEKKADLDGVGVACPSAVACPDPHDADNLYTLASTIRSALPGRPSRCSSHS